MKIAYVVRNYNRRGGVSGYVAELAREASLKNETHVYSASIEDADENIVKHIIPSSSSKFLKKIKKYAWNVAVEIQSFMKQSSDCISQHQYDIVHSQGDYSAYCDVYTAHSCHKEWLNIARSNASGFMEGLIKSRFNPLHALILKSEYYGITRSRKVIAISQRIKQELITNYAIPQEKVVVIPNGVNTERFSVKDKQLKRKTVREKYNLKDNDVVAIFPAHEFKRKGLSKIIDAYFELKIDNLFLLVVGRDDPAGFYAEIAKHELKGKIIFVGEQADIEDYYLASDMMIFPTVYEPFGLVITEAMACGLPVIVSAVAGAAELITDKKDGVLLSDANDSIELAEKIKWLITNKGMSDDIGRNARITAEKYSWDIISGKTFGLYDAILKDKQQEEAKIKVCMFARSLPAHSMGGMELHVETLSKELVKSGVDVTIITTFNPLGVEYENKHGVKIHYLKGTMPGRYEFGYYERSAAKFIELNKSEKYDLIHSQSAGAYSIIQKRINKNYNIPVVATLHGTSVDEIKTKLRLGYDIRTKISLAKNHYSYLFRDRMFLNNCDAIIATSDSQVGVINKYYGVPESKIKLVYNGIDDELFTPIGINKDALKAKYGINTEDKVIAAVARLKKEKGVQNIISVLPEVLKKINPVKLIIAGSGEYREKLENMVKQLGLNGSVKFIGRIEYKDLPELLNCSNVFVNSTVRENGYDLTIPQAMACEKTVLVSDMRSVFTIIENGKNGFIYKRTRLVEMKDRLIEILSDVDLQKQIGVAARKTVEDKFSLKTMVNSTIAVYNEYRRITNELQ